MSGLLQVDDLSVHLRGRDGRRVALLENISLGLDRGETLGIVGESGCGKSILALSLLGLLPPGIVASGRLRLDGTDLLGLPERALCRLRGRRLAMVFQEPMRALNPRQPIGRQVAEGMRLHLGLNRADADARARALLDRVGLPQRLAAAEALPHRLSGGQRQRVMIAIALACDPALLIADEFSTALDTVTQAQILQLLAELGREKRMALLLITHDLALAAQLCQRSLVLYAGRAVEDAATTALFARRAHPYTQGLFNSALLDGTLPPGTLLPAIPGQVPPPGARGPGCHFANRCAAVQPDCLPAQPPLRPLDASAGGSPHAVACLHPLAAA